MTNRIAYILFAFLSFLGKTLFAQEVKLIDNDSMLKYYLSNSDIGFDQNNDAIILYSGQIIDVSTGKLSDLKRDYLAERIEICYKINSLNTSDLGLFNIPNSSNININNFKLYVVNLENGGITKQEIKKKDLLKEKITDGLKIYKINISDLRKGTIVYYSYTVQFETSPMNFMGQGLAFKWLSKSNYPTIESRLELNLTKDYGIKIATKNIIFDTASSYSIFNILPQSMYIANYHPNANTKRSTTIYWKRSDLQPQIKEDYLVHPDLFDSSIKISIFDVRQFMFNQDKKWCEQTQNAYFPFLTPSFIDGYQLNDTLLTTLNKMVEKNIDSLERATAIYKFVRDSMKSNYNDPQYYLFSKTNYNGNIKAKQSYSLNNNKLLTVLLRKNGFKAFNVLLSSNEKITKEKFDAFQIDYLVTAVIIGPTTYFLDASIKHLPFGAIPTKCYNGFAWVVNYQGTAIDLHPSMINNKTIVSCTLTPKDSTEIFNLKIKQRFGNTSGSYFRTLLLEDSVGVKEAFEIYERKLFEDYMILKDYKIANKNNSDEPLQIDYEMEYNPEPVNGYLYINPFFSKFVQVNPFKNVARMYPIEFDSPINKQYLLKIQIPKEYTLDDNIENKTILFDNGTITYFQSSLFDIQSNTLSLSYNIKSKVDIISKNQYEELRSFYEKIIVEQNKKLALKRVQ